MSDLKKAARVIREENAGPDLQPGTWWWVKVRTGSAGEPKEGTPLLCCLVHLGSNYASFESAGDRRYTDIRVHLDQFDQEATFEPNAEHFIKQQIETRRREVARLMGQVQDVTARLALNAGQQSETEALVVSTGSTPVEEYKTALVKAKDETLPTLFNEIKSNNESMGRWMQAELIPLEAAAKGLKPQIKRIENRIFNVELYSGLIEEIVQVREGDPAAAEEPLHLYQRRAYMDEECLAAYKTGGMEFGNLPSFDRWMADPENLDRLMPHPRSILAMQVRRFDKDYGDVSLREFIRIHFEGLKELNKLTFLYIRNGQRLYRLMTGIEFGAQLFPDIDRSKLDGKLWARIEYGKVQEMITEDDLIIRKRNAAERAKGHKAKVREWERRTKELKAQGLKWGDKGWPDDVDHFPPHNYSWEDRHLNDFKPWSPEDVYYDDISKHVSDEIDKHNRLVLVLQGLFDRSEVLNPHPPTRLWDPEHFSRSIRLVFDDSRALTPGDAPDFEEYRRRLNAGLKVGAVTVGQEDFWEEVEAERENRRQANDWRVRDKSNYQRFRPSGDPGPGTLAKIARLTKAGALYEWGRERRGRNRWEQDGEPIRSTVTVPTDRLLNADAYTPGDFKIFFNDPRTRANYLQWAPYLLEAEEYHAGNRGLRPFYTPFKEAHGVSTGLTWKIQEWNREQAKRKRR